MGQATRLGQLRFSDYLDRAWRETGLWALVVAALYLLLALVSYSPSDPGWSFVGESAATENSAGRVGAWFADLALFLFGLLAYLIPVAVAWGAYLLFRDRQPDPETKLLQLVLRSVGLLVTLIAGSGLVSLQFADAFASLPSGVGGGLGLLVAGAASSAFGTGGGSLVLAGLLVIGLTLFTGVSPMLVLEGVGDLTLLLVQQPLRLWRRLTAGGAMEPDAARAAEARSDPETEGVREDVASPPASSADDPGAARWSGATDPPEGFIGLDAIDLDDAAEPAERGGPAPAPWSTAPTAEAAAEAAPAGRAAVRPAARPQDTGAPAHDDGVARPRRSLFKRAPRGEAPQPRSAEAAGERPPLELLDPARHSGHAVSPEQLESMSRELEARLAEFGVVAEVVEVHPGPVVALFELELAPGVKVSKITGLAKDIARAMSRISVRVVEVIPGKSVIGLEVPNDQREMVMLSEILGARVYREAKSPLTIGMGTNIAGEPVVADLGRMPHALIAGTTGSGKSVAINAMILSLVYKAGPEEVRLIMVDPKMLELSVYEGIPHLLTPVVTDMKEAANALRWCVGEMERRYKLMAALGVRNITGYNRKVQDAIEAGEPIVDPTWQPPEGAFGDDGPEPPTLEKLPYIVVIIDELADMMMVVGKKVEELIARLAQKARASGIHLLLATQRPSVDVLTGLIKANIPTRMAFKVSARVDSRTVLDQMGAEHLLGHGDMLYLPPGGSIPQRVHGAFVDDHEVHRVVGFLKQQGAPAYIETILQEPSDHLPGIDPEPKGGGDVEDQDPLFDEAVQIVVESRRASISGVQRRLKIGYNRAARMIEEMERIGIVGPAESNGNREVLAPPPPED